jgi:multidrug resistance efflux pump
MEWAGVAAVNPILTWVRRAQRVPVHVHIDHVPPVEVQVAGMTATVQIDDRVYTDEINRANVAPRDQPSDALKGEGVSLEDANLSEATSHKPSRRRPPSGLPAQSRSGGQS